MRLPCLFKGLTAIRICGNTCHIADTGRNGDVLGGLASDTILVVRTTSQCQNHCHQGKEISLLFHCLLLFYVYILVLILAK